MIQMNKKILITLIIIFLVLVAVTVGVVFNIKENNIEVSKTNKGISNTTDEYIPDGVKKGNDNDIIYKVAETTYNNQRLYLSVPSTWKFEIVENGGETPTAYKANYGIKIYKEELGKEKYAGIYSLTEKFGVCGTGLVTEKITTEIGEQASVGYFDGGKDWNYVAFNDGSIIALNNGLEDDIAKEALNILKSMNYIDSSNIEMIIKEGSLTKTSATLIMKAKNKEEKFSTGAAFEIEKKEKGTWTGLPINAEVTWIAIAYIPNDEGIIEIKADWKDLYGELEKGEYRISKQLAQNVNVYAEFTIE